MKYIISVTNRKGIEPFEIPLDNTTEVNDVIDWENEKYTVNEIVIVDPQNGLINLKCSIKPKNRTKELTTKWS
jgi:hypothetical protein